MKRVLGGMILFLCCFAAVAAVHIVVWYNFEPPVREGYVCRDVAANLTGNTKAAGRKWFKQYMDGLKGWKVPYSFRVEKARLDKVEALEHACVQLDYTVWPSSANQDVMMNLRLAGTQERYKYQGQIVLKWDEKISGMSIAETMSPVQYQIQTPEFQEEIRRPQTEHYEMADDQPETYCIKDGVLYVTYDSGEHLTEVPEGYEGVCATPNGTYNEWLPYNSYVISNEFTAFVDYSGGHASLLYSTDAGKTWKRSSIGDGYRANTFLSKTEDACYVTFAADRALGSDIYITYRSEDIKRWERVGSADTIWSNLNCVFWVNDTTGYYSRGERMLSVTTDGGMHFQETKLITPQELTDRLGFDPYDTVEKIYVENGIVYAVEGQGDDGDYMQDGELMKALFCSEDGIHFTFVKEIQDSPKQAG